MNKTHAEITYDFPEGFLWGTATSAHQVEGNNTNNDWWDFEQYAHNRPTNEIHDNQTSGDACGWWNNGCALPDIDLMAQMGTNAHRLSLEWSRIEPVKGKWDQSAITKYREWLVHMTGQGIKPMVTLFHFTMPFWLASEGGWLNPNSVSYFKRFTEKVVTEFGDLVDLWCTVARLRNRTCVIISPPFLTSCTGTRWPIMPSMHCNRKLRWALPNT
jgi:beta-glucosidase